METFEIFEINVSIRLFTLFLFSKEEWMTSFTARSTDIAPAS